MRSYLINRPARAGIASANLAIGTASAFVLATAAASLLADRDVARPNVVGADWTLRRTIAPFEARGGVAPKRAEVAIPRPSFVEGARIFVVFQPHMAKVGAGA